MSKVLLSSFQHIGGGSLQLFGGTNLKSNAQPNRFRKVSCCASKPAEALEKREKEKQQPYQGILHVQAGDRIEELDHRETSLLVKEVKGWLMKLASGKWEISPSTYDTAWVARIPSDSDSSLPEFPEALEWIINSQLPDGSWGDDCHLQLYDRVFSTLSCLVTLKLWDIGHNSIAQGTKFLRENMIKLNHADGDFLSGFEVTFPMMLHEAKRVGLKLPYDTEFTRLLEISTTEKLAKIPLDRFHSTPTTLLYSLEGLQGLEIDWQKILKLQSKDGSFFSSPSSTACVYLKTKDKKSLQYLQNAMKHQNYAVSCHYPIDLFESLRVVDTIERLGIDLFFRDEIKAVLDYLYSFWTNEGIGWESTCIVNDIEDTAMAFRILRMHGYSVSPDAFNQFWLPVDKFSCFVGELSHGVSAMLNLYRASQVDFPNEEILTKTFKYSHDYLLNVENSHTSATKKNLMGEVTFELANPFHDCLPRIYNNAYIKHYSIDDPWIAKTIYQLPLVNKKVLLELANRYAQQCQSYQPSELKILVKWWHSSHFEDIPSTRFKANINMLPYIYYVICATFHEQEFGPLRIFFTKTCCMNTLFDDILDSAKSITELDSLQNMIESWDTSFLSQKEYKIIFQEFYNTILVMTKMASKINQNLSPEFIHKYLLAIYTKLIKFGIIEARWKIQGYIPGFEEYMEHAEVSIAIATHVLMGILFCGDPLTEELLNIIYDSKLLKLGSIISRICNDIQTYKIEMKLGESAQGVSCYMKDHPGATEEDALAYLQSLLEKTKKQLNKIYFTEKDLPKNIKRFSFDMARGMMFTYNKAKQDLFKNPNKELQSMIELCLET
ncbi:bifunctional diterpene synthase, chloroplastic-like isoform X1 [Selaginella moellendorffii]|uniref:bifunctional diterpene synthase, chloroplastic-like isoform X1 n=1 Tax=Selaginella moellendorffii TaxID=88036 RepID=UPI000D1CE8DC|nr:bifunctional diterpene synthase, chloroplastic-like isoform X1 [Selaginella moellendorffii]|eukprot:XP_024526103.1 bifunctional diterpene synthase, chloroplastic-like isoform X1 [Selaginella moellendorffii]